jgi:hypothetical protein
VPADDMAIFPVLNSKCCRKGSSRSTKVIFLIESSVTLSKKIPPFLITILSLLIVYSSFL